MTNAQTDTPIKIIKGDASKNKTTFTLGPFPLKLGTTLGNALRRALFFCTEGWAITSVRLSPAMPHEFAAIDGVREDMTNILLQLKQVRFKKKDASPEDKIRVVIKDKKIFTAKDIADASASFEVLNPAHVICHMDKAVSFDIELTLTKGAGYITSEELKPAKQVFGTFYLDAIYSPVTNVKFNIENVVVGRRADNENVILEITTDGSLTPEEALKNTADSLREQFAIIADGKAEKVSSKLRKEAIIEDSEVDRVNNLLATPISKLPLSARLINNLVAAGYETCRDIVIRTPIELMLVPNIGKKCVQELEAFVKSENLALGVDLSPLA